MNYSHQNIHTLKGNCLLSNLNEFFVCEEIISTRGIQQIIPTLSPDMTFASITLTPNLSTCSIVSLHRPALRLMFWVNITWLPIFNFIVCCRRLYILIRFRKFVIYIEPPKFMFELSRETEYDDAYIVSSPWIKRINPVNHFLTWWF